MQDKDLLCSASFPKEGTIRPKVKDTYLNTLHISTWMLQTRFLANIFLSLANNQMKHFHLLNAYFPSFQFPGAVASGSYPRCAATLLAGEKSCCCFVRSRLCTFSNPLEPQRNSLARLFPTSQTSCARITCSVWHNILKLFCRWRPFLMRRPFFYLHQKMSHNTGDAHPIKFPGHCRDELHANEVGKAQGIE